MADEDASAAGRPGERVLGLIAEPGLAEEIAHKIAGELPALLTQTPGDRWRVEVLPRVLPLDPQGNLPLQEVGANQLERGGWDVAVVVTELPRRAGIRPILADCAPAQKVGLVSLAAMGAIRIRHRTRNLVLHLVTTYLAPRTAEGQLSAATGRRTAITSRYRTVDEHEVRETSEQAAEQAADTNVDLAGEGVHLALSGRRGRARLLAGMVRANRPWRLVPSLAPALAGAMAGAAFGIFYSSIWPLADASSTLRLALVNVLAIAAMTVWLILGNSLWERSREPHSRTFSRLYNTVTLLSVTSGVVIMFLLLLAATFLAAWIIIPPNYLASTLHHRAAPSDWVTLAWLAACLGTIAGALGSGLASEQAVRKAAYSRRERERQDRRRAQEAHATQKTHG
ncbi:hypothetical protein [Streptomyces smyrnaeus]|uniref:hypothetical protein n=1 Tax=Streptomyces smyrnaeus TaxID=1387713 RepID=UPI003680BB11